MEYIKEHLVDSPKDYISTKEIWEDYKRWYVDSGRAANKKPHKQTTQAEFETRLGKPIGEKFIGWRFKTNIDNNDNFTNTEILNSSFNMSSNVQQNNNLDNDINEDNPIDNLFIKTKA